MNKKKKNLKTKKAKLIDWLLPDMGRGGVVAG